ncbi:MAG: hypothetical protein IIB17_04235 [Chloroflexi bacterium]|nr:hypothetical protein [Chloroflexota bacterium]
MIPSIANLAAAIASEAWEAGEAGDVETVRAVNPNDDVDADYPLIVTHPIHGPFIVWQGAGLTRFTIESVRIEKASGRIIRLTPASGASGLAIQNLNLMLGFSENTGLPEASE